MTLMAQRMFEAYNNKTEQEQKDKAMKTEITYMSIVCQCFGALKEDSNFEMVFENEEMDDVWCEGNPIDGLGFGSWYDVVVAITDQMGEVPLQLEAV